MPIAHSAGRKGRHTRKNVLCHWVRAQAASRIASRLPSDLRAKVPQRGGVGGSLCMCRGRGGQRRRARSRSRSRSESHPLRLRCTPSRHGFGSPDACTCHGTTARAPHSVVRCQAASKRRLRMHINTYLTYTWRCTPALQKQLHVALPGSVVACVRKNGSRLPKAGDTTPAMFHVYTHTERGTCQFEVTRRSLRSTRYSYCSLVST